MAEARQGDNVKVHYTGKFDDGTIFDSSRGGEPLEFTVGEGQVIPGFEDAVKGMSAGESKTVTIPANEAYGPHRDELVMMVSKESMPPDYEPTVGDQLQLTHPSGQQMVVTVTDVSSDSVTLDANHPLAGEDLTFEIELEEIK